EAGEVTLVVFYPCGQDATLILPCRQLAGNSSRIGSVGFDHVFDTPRGVVKRHGTNQGMFTKKFSALIQSHRVRVDLSDFSQFGSWRRNQVVNDAELEFAHDKEFMREKQI